MHNINLNGQSLDVVKDNVEKLKQLFPEIVTEDNIDFDKLKAVLGEYIEKNDENYRFTWFGKRDAFRKSQTPSTGTLRPCIEESKDWDTTQNLYIEGDNLEVLKLLQKSYNNKIKMIYIDPPYNKDKDFIYPDKWSNPIKQYKKITKQIDEDENVINSDIELEGGRHTKWLNMMYPRLRLARNLLKDEGVIFISIDDDEMVNLKKLCDEVFGEENFVSELPRITKRGGKSSESIAKNHDYVLVYKKSDLVQFYPLVHNDNGFKYQDEYFEERGYYKLNQTLDYDSLQYSQSLDYPLQIDDEIFYAGSSERKYKERQRGNHNRADWAWRWSKLKFDFGIKNGFIVVKSSRNGKRIYTKTYLKASIVEVGNDYSVVIKERTKPMSTLVSERRQNGFRAKALSPFLSIFYILRENI